MSNTPLEQTTGNQRRIRKGLRQFTGSFALPRLQVEKKILHDFSVALHWVEVGLATLSLVFVIYGIIFLVGELTHFNDLISRESLHIVFEDLLSDILLLVVGIELAIMLVRRTPESLVEVMFFVVARKMLIKTGTITELLIGVVALAGLFAIRKYLEELTLVVKEEKVE
jgi:hypothetical protein